MIKKAWSALGLLIVGMIVTAILYQAVLPYLPVVGLVFCVIIVAAITYTAIRLVFFSKSDF